MTYQDDQHRPVFVHTGISGGDTVYWASYRRKPTGNLQRIKTKFLPLREDKKTAQADLDRYAKKKKWAHDETTH